MVTLEFSRAPTQATFWGAVAAIVAGRRPGRGATASFVLTSLVIS